MNTDFSGLNSGEIWCFNLIFYEFGQFLNNVFILFKYNLFIIILFALLNFTALMFTFLYTLIYFCFILCQFIIRECLIILILYS